jgi:hypothetical protein
VSVNESVSQKVTDPEYLENVINLHDGRGSALSCVTRGTVPAFGKPHEDSLALIRY